MPKTLPELYEGKLAAEGVMARELAEEKLRKLYKRWKKAKGIEQLRLREEIDFLKQSLAWQGANPKLLDPDELIAHIRAPTGNDNTVNKYRARIKSRQTAIRAYCVWCQGGDMAGVRTCSTPTCPLYSFRMGKNLFFGFEIPKVEEPIIEDEDELVGDFEDNDDAD